MKVVCTELKPQLGLYFPPGIGTEVTPWATPLSTVHQQPATVPNPMRSLRGQPILHSTLCC